MLCGAHLKHCAYSDECVRYEHIYLIYVALVFRRDGKTDTSINTHIYGVRGQVGTPSTNCY